MSETRTVDGIEKWHNRPSTFALLAGIWFVAFCLRLAVRDWDGTILTLGALSGAITTWSALAELKRATRPTARKEQE